MSRKFKSSELEKVIPDDAKKENKRPSKIPRVENREPLRSLTRVANCPAVADASAAAPSVFPVQFFAARHKSSNITINNKSP